MPMIEPATAVAISQRKNSWPMSSDVGDGDAHHGMPRALQCVDGGVLRRIGLRIQPHIDEEPILIVDGGGAERLAIDGDQTLPLFARGFGDQLLEPCAKVRDAGRGNERDLVTADASKRAQDRAQDDRWILLGGDTCRTGVHHQFRAVEQPSDIDTHQRCRDHAEIRERRIAAADAGTPKNT